MPLDVTGIAPSVVPSSVLEYAELGLRERRQAIWNETKIFTSPVLEYKYVYSAHSHFWEVFVGNKLHAIFLEELRKLGPVPVSLQGAMPQREDKVHEFMVSFVRPGTWAYLNESISALYEEWEQHQVEWPSLNTAMERMRIQRSG